MIEIISGGTPSDNRTQLLIEESISPFNNRSSIRSAEKETMSEEVTFNKMLAGITSFGNILVRSFGTAISQRISTLMHKRNEIIRDYYLAMRNVICHKNTCVLVSITEPQLGKRSSGSSTGRDANAVTSEHSLSKFEESTGRNFVSLGARSSQSIDTITEETGRKLEYITREITDNIATVFHIRDVDQTSDKKMPLIHYQRFYNLLNMYDKELINQAKAYASKNYDISMNCAQSSLELTHHISDEIILLIKESQQKNQDVR
jgi:hypothetical protein